MKLFTMFSTVDRAVAETRSRRKDIDAVVKRIAGCEEWGVRIVRTPGGPELADRRRPMSGAAFLAAKRRTRDEAREAARVAAEMAQGVFEALSAIAREARRREGAPAGATALPLLDAAFLVPGARRARFKAAARRLSSRSAAVKGEMTLTGPWPAYNFVEAGERA